MVAEELTIRCRLALRLWLVALLMIPAAAAAESAKADGFSRLPQGAVVAVMPLDIELFTISAGGVLEPQAEWTAQAHENLRQAFLTRKSALGVDFKPLDDDGDPRIESLNRLHGAVGDAITLHRSGLYALPTKEGRLDWSLGEEASAIREKTGADYALFSYVRDSYASGERVAAMVIGALLGVGMAGGAQVGYASLVDLSTGQIVWFNRLSRAYGDLRDPQKAVESAQALLAEFPD
jgi:hypothetical protein